MNKDLFIKIWNLLTALGRTQLGKSKASIVCFSPKSSDTSAIAAVLPAGWSVKHNPPAFNPERQAMGDAMIVVFKASQVSADEAFAEFAA